MRISEDENNLKTLISEDENNQKMRISEEKGKATNCIRTRISPSYIVYGHIMLKTPVLV